MDNLVVLWFCFWALAFVWYSKGTPLPPLWYMIKQRINKNAIR